MNLTTLKKLLLGFVSSKHTDDHQLFHRELTASSGASAGGCKYKPSHCLCLGALKGSGFKIHESRNFHKFFSNESQLQFPGAGIQRGVEGIAEYIDFVGKGILFHEIEEVMRFENLPLPESTTYDPAKSQCTIAVVVPSCVSFSEFAKGGSVASNYGLKMTFEILNTPSILDRRFDIHISNVGVFFSKPFYAIVQDALSTDAMANKVCDIMESNCPHTFAKNFPEDQKSLSSCVDKVHGLENDAHSPGFLGGNSVGCRVIHASLAARNSDHCPHISLIPEADKNEKFKCQTSQNVTPSDLFSEVELEMFDNYVAKPMMETGVSTKDVYFESDTCMDRFPSFSQSQEAPRRGSIIAWTISTLAIIVTISAVFMFFILRKYPSQHCESSTDLSASEDEDRTEELGSIINFITSMSTGGGHEVGSSNRWISVVGMAFASFIIMNLCIVPLVLYVIEPSVNDELNTYNLDLFDEQLDNDFKWGLTDSHPQSSLEGRRFSLYLSLLLWVWTNLAGFGLEIFVAMTALKDGWTSNHEYWWRFVQHVFPFVATITFGMASSRNYLSLVFLLASLWKCGFPESVSTLYVALFDTSISNKHRICHLYDALGLIFHHISASLIICVLVTGLARTEESLLGPIVILCMQHSLSLVRYHFQKVYIGVLVLLEIWFQWTVISNIEHYVVNHWTCVVAAIGMIYAHCIWFWVGVFKSATTPRTKVGGGGGGNSGKGARKLSFVTTATGVTRRMSRISLCANAEKKFISENNGTPLPQLFPLESIKVDDDDMA